VQGGNTSIFVRAGSVPGFPGKVKNTKVLANLVSGAAFQGIQVSTRDAVGSSIDSTTITGNSSSLSDIGIQLFTNFSAAGSNTSITNTNVTDNLVSGNDIGILVNPFMGDNNTLTGITIARNTVTDNNGGIIADGGETSSNGNLLKVTIKDNTVSGNSFPGGAAGILVRGGLLSSSNNHVDARILKERSDGQYREWNYRARWPG